MFSGIDFGVRAARAREVELWRQVGQGEPAFDARRHGLRPAQLGHGRQQAGRHGRRHQRLGARELVGRRLLLARQGVDRDAIGEAGGLDRIEIGGGVVGPQQDVGADWSRGMGSPVSDVYMLPSRSAARNLSACSRECAGRRRKDASAALEAEGSAWMKGRGERLRTSRFRWAELLHSFTGAAFERERRVDRRLVVEQPRRSRRLGRRPDPYRPAR